jgi:hypothetical protein
MQFAWQLIFPSNQNSHVAAKSITAPIGDRGFKFVTFLRKPWFMCDEARR